MLSACGILDEIGFRILICRSRSRPDQRFACHSTYWDAAWRADSGVAFASACGSWHHQRLPWREFDRSVPAYTVGCTTGRADGDGMATAGSRVLLTLWIDPSRGDGWPPEAREGSTRPESQDRQRQEGSHQPTGVREWRADQWGMIGTLRGWSLIWIIRIAWSQIDLSAIAIAMGQDVVLDEACFPCSERSSSSGDLKPLRLPWSHPAHSGRLQVHLWCKLQNERFEYSCLESHADIEWLRQSLVRRGF
jgi:hypothetical protein